MANNTMEAANNGNIYSSEFNGTHASSVVLKEFKVVEPQMADKLNSSAYQSDDNRSDVSECPDTFVDKMLQKIVNKYPNTSYVTVEKFAAPGAKFLQSNSHYMMKITIMNRLFNNSVPHNIQMCYFNKGSFVSSPYAPALFNPANSLKENSQVNFDKYPIDMQDLEMTQLNTQWSPEIINDPQVQYEDKIQEVTQIQRITERIPKIEVVDVPYEVIKFVPKVQTKIVEQVVNVPNGQKIPVCRPYIVDSVGVMPKFVDKDIPVVVSQSIGSAIEERNEYMDVEVARYVPKLVYVDVFIPKPVNVPVKFEGQTDETEPAVLYDDAMQQLMTEMNPHLLQLDAFNDTQNQKFQSMLEQSAAIARQYNLPPLDPIINPLFTIEEQKKAKFAYCNQKIMQNSKTNKNTGSFSFSNIFSMNIFGACTKTSKPALRDSYNDNIYNMPTSAVYSPVFVGNSRKFSSSDVSIGNPISQQRSIDGSVGPVWSRKSSIGSRKSAVVSRKSSILSMNSVARSVIVQAN